MIEFDPATGALRLPMREFTTLARWGESSGPPDEDEAVSALGEACVLTDRGPHPLLKPGLAAVRRPTCEIQIDVAGPGGVAVHHGWVAPEAAAFLVSVRGQTKEFLAMGPTFVPAGVAQVLRFEPRPSLRLGPFTSPLDLVGGLLSTDEPSREKAIAALLQASGADDPWTEAIARQWRASHTVVGWVGPDGSPTGRDLTLFDCPAGLLAMDRPDDTTVRWSPVSVTEAWRALVQLLPGDSELGPER